MRFDRLASCLERALGPGKLLFTELSAPGPDERRISIWHLNRSGHDIYETANGRGISYRI